MILGTLIVIYERYRETERERERGERERERERDCYTKKGRGEKGAREGT